MFVHPSSTFIAPVYSLADTGQSSFVWHLQQQWGIQRTLHFYQSAVLYARANTSTDADVLHQPSPTTVVFIYKMLKMLEMLSSTEIGLACYNHIPASSRLASHLFVCRARPSPTTQPLATVRLRLFRNYLPSPLSTVFYSPLSFSARAPSLPFSLSYPTLYVPHTSDIYPCNRCRQV